MQNFSQYNYTNIKNSLDTTKKYDAIILAVSHNEFLSMDIKHMLKDKGVIFDVKGCLPKKVADARL
ncbi:MAG: UDP binding domain-containing protein [Rikenellaceae bacterium]